MCGINNWQFPLRSNCRAIPPPPATRGWGSPAFLLKCGSAVKLFNLSDKIQEISMSANKVYRKQLYRQGVRG